MNSFFCKYRRFLAYVFLACWFISSIASVHTHLCLDGNQQQVTVQFDVLDTLTKVDVDRHEDVDVYPLKLLFTKLLKVDLLFLLTVFVLVCLFVPVGYQATALFPCPVPLPFLLRPPLRAPPSFLA